LNYDQIGRTYNNTRMPDPRITERIIKYLGQPAGSQIIDIGAGTGNYSYELAENGFDVVAIEPSAVMRNQGKKHNKLKWVEGIAEKLPVDDRSVDGVICTLATHHFTNLELSFREMARVIKPHGKIVIFTADPRTVLESCWIAEYFREIVERSCNAQPEKGTLKQMFETNTGRTAAIHSFPLPHDLKDKFFFSGWRTPELYLNDEYRSGISSLAAAPKELLEENLKKLADDLRTTDWHDKYGEIKSHAEYDCGYFFLVG